MLLFASARRRFLVVFVKLINVSLHAYLCPAHAVTLGFFLRLRRRPAIVRDAIAGDDCPGAIFTMVAVDKDRLIIRGIDDVEHLLDFFVFWGGEARQRDAVIAQSQRSSCIALRSRLIVCAAQVDDRFDPVRFQLLQAARFWLRAPIELRVDLMKIWQLGVAGLALGESVAGQNDQQQA